jgi:DNA-binding protein H-NS
VVITTDYLTGERVETKPVDGKVIDWAEYSDEEIERFIIELETVRKKRREAKRQALKDQIEGMVKEHGISLAELFPNTEKVRGRSKEKRVPAGQDVKFRNPVDPSQTWTGKGRKPAWLIEALTSGKTLEDFAV